MVGFAATVRADVFNMGTGLTSLETVWVGNPGNAADPQYGYGAVAYTYKMGKYEVTNAQYCEFLNEKAKSDTYGLYNTLMSSHVAGGIDRSGSLGYYSYSVKSGYANMPVNYVSWYDSIRFANWLQNGQGSGGTESGTYAITGGGSNSGTVAIPNAATRATWNAANPHWVLPSENEWYKAAYHQPATQGGDTDNYWLYPTATNTEPYSDQPPGSDAPDQANTANFIKNDSVVNGYNDGYAVTGTSTGFEADTENCLTDVGAYTLSDSFYGTFDQGGNVWELNEAIRWTSQRGTRGGTAYDSSSHMAASNREHSPYASDEFYIVGFRVASVASVPEPGSITLLMTGGIATFLFFWQRQRRVG
jgi:formylglycine-generating enzyme